MKKLLKLMLLGALLSGVTEAGAARKGVSKVPSMSEEQQAAIAMSAAPKEVSADATIMVYGKDGKLREIKKGTNGFTCIPDIDAQEDPDPFCGDEAATQWLMDALEKKDKPSNTAPGVAYMAKGGWHWEKDGRIIMNREEPGAKRVKEPPHWMIFWPFEPGKTILPAAPAKGFGSYIMYDGTPYAHLMIYQDPMRMKKK